MTSIKEVVNEEVAPIIADMAELTARVGKLELCSNKFGSALFDPTDSAHKRVAFVGFTSMDLNARMQEMNAFCAKFPQIRPLACGNFYGGPYSNRTLTKAGYAEFTDADAAKAFFKLAEKSTLKVGSDELTVKMARSKINTTRNWAIRKAHELLKAAAIGKKVDIEWKERVVKVDDIECFVQGKMELRGSFMGNYSTLTLPK